MHSYDRVTVPAHTAILVRDTVSPTELSALTSEALPNLREFLISTGANPGPARAYILSEPAGTFDVGVGFVVDDADLPLVEPFAGDTGDDRVELVHFAQTLALTHRHTGPRTELSRVWSEFAAKAAAASEPLGTGSFEEFVTELGPAGTGVSGDTAVTDLYLHLRAE